MSFLEQSARNRDCLRELKLNRRLASDVYLGVAAIACRDGGFVVGEVDSDPDTLPGPPSTV